MQSRYLLDPSAEEKSPPSPYNYKWDIPITWITNSDPKEQKIQWMDSNEPFELGTIYIKISNNNIWSQA